MKICDELMNKMKNLVEHAKENDNYGKQTVTNSFSKKEN